ncbi:dihydroorotase family protein [Sphingomonas sp. CGMCC 1.13654]|uniref:Dihydroorotase family protein n=1 Tax=Sphingomonas chungangi TaxID=2683589 RepID=A0A838L2D0_9SPHN|nr:dihydroorotase family protein [Sphingomonas chungangi]MBA2933541.1 dihydroorotase family protein [Sphingomonas chungangi]MVW54874.1 amidohydrolase family protein [Sphingomonas chungangi]
MSNKVFVGTVVLPDRIIEHGWVLASGGLIRHVGEGPPPAGERHGGAGMLVLPGVIDAQVHSRSQKDQEDFIWSTRSAAAGGVTTIVDMPYDDGDLICTAEQLTRKAEEAAAQARVDFALYATIDPVEGSTRIDELVEAGAAAFKFSTFGTHPQRFPRIAPHLMHDCFAAIARHGLMAGVHNEDDETVRAMTERVRASGETGYAAHGKARPPISEALATAQVYEIGASTGCAAHIVHCSIGRGYELAAAYRAQGHTATIEACIHYLMLDEDDVARLVGLAKVNPPLRTVREREALWRHLAVGNITVVSTDHVSWSLDRKSDPDMLANASGMPGLEALLPLLMKGLDERGLPFSHAARLLAHNPAGLFRLGGAKGAIAVGTDADILLMSRSPYRYDPAASGNNVVGWSPYAGMEMPWRVDAAYLRGELISADGKVVAEPGTGRFQRPGRRAA